MKLRNFVLLASIASSVAFFAACSSTETQATDHVTSSSDRHDALVSAVSGSTELDAVATNAERIASLTQQRPSGATKLPVVVEQLQRAGSDDEEVRRIVQHEFTQADALLAAMERNRAAAAAFSARFPELGAMS